MRPSFGHRITLRIAPFVLAMGVLVTSPARAATPSQDLDAAESAYADLDYDKANKLADAVVKQRGLTHAELVRAYRILGRTHAILDHGNQAIDSFKLLLAYSPDEKPDASLPPKITDAFSSARGFWAGYTTKPGIEVQTAVHAREPGALRVTTRDPMRLVKRVVVGYRWGTTGTFVTSSVASGDSVAVDLPASPANVSRLDYFAQALDERDDAAYEFGTPQAPKTLTVELPVEHTPVGEQPKSRSLFASPVFWVVAAGVLAGAGTGIYFAARKPEAATTANIGPVFFCGAARCN